MSTQTPPASVRPAKKIVVPKVWKRPHSTIYGKNVEFGSSLYRDKIGELNGRKFNSELPWTVRNSGLSSSVSSGSSSSYGNQSGYLSNLLLVDANKDKESQHYDLSNFAHQLELTNPARISKRQPSRRSMQPSGASRGRVDFYDDYQLTFERELQAREQASLLANAPLIGRTFANEHLEFDYQLGLFLPSCSLNSLAQRQSNFAPSDHKHFTLTSSNEPIFNKTIVPTSTNINNNNTTNANQHHTNPIKPTPVYTSLLPKHTCHLASSPYGPSNDGRKLSLGSIKPHSYRPSLPQKTTVAHSSDGEEFEFQDKSSPFYTDRWAGKTIRHFDSDLYSNANLFKSMIL